MRLRATRLTAIATAVRKLFSPTSLFANGEQGWVYDPSNLSTLFQDSAGTTPVTAMEQPVGLQLDTRLGLLLGTDVITNGSFATDTVWTKQTGWSISGGAAVKTAGTASHIYQTVSGASGYVAGAYVEITLSVVVSTGVLRVSLDGSTYSNAINTSGTYTLRLRGLSSTFYILGEATFAGSVDDVTCKIVQGNHRYQTTSANRPVVSARVNQLVNTAFSGAVAGTPGTAPTNWSANGTGGSISAVGADTITITASANRLYLTPTTAYTAVVGSHTSVVTVTAASAGLTFSNLFEVLAGTATATNTYYANGAVVNNSTYVVNAGDVLTVVSSVTVAGTVFYRFGLGPNGPTTGTATFKQPDIRLTNIGVGLPAYQRVNTSTDYDTAGFPVYIKPNGSNQFMVTNSINFSATDKMTVWQGVRKLSDAAQSVVSELSTTAANAGAFGLYAPASPAANYSFLNTGTTSVNVVASGVAAPITNVLTAIESISAPINTLRVNGTQAATSSASQGTGNYGNYPAYFYMRAGASLPFNGHDYGSICRGAASTAGEITSAETWINQRTKAF